MKAGRIDLAISHYQKSIELSPDNGKSHLNLGIAYGKMGKINEAIKMTLRVQVTPPR